MTQLADIAISGASVAGLHAAHLLAERGRQVVVFERATELDPVPRTLIVTSRFRGYFGDLGESSIVNEIDRFELYVDGRMVTVPLREPDLIIERAALIRRLAKEAADSGAEIRLGGKVEALTVEHGGLVLRVTGSSEKPLDFKASTVIGADGVASRMAIAAGWPRQKTAPLVQALVRLPEGMSRTTTRVWFRPSDTPYFFWLIPESPEVGALGLIGGGRTNPRAILDGFLDEMGLEPIGYQAAKVPVGLRWRRISRSLSDASVHLVGDAAGHVKVSTVGGIVTGARGVLGVVGRITGGPEERELKALHRELVTHTFVRRVMSRFRESDYIRLLGLMDGKLAELLGSATRDDAPRIIWDALRTRPDLLPVAARGLLFGRPRSLARPLGRESI